MTAERERPAPQVASAQTDTRTDAQHNDPEDARARHDDAPVSAKMRATPPDSGVTAATLVRLVRLARATRQFAGAASLTAGRWLRASSWLPAWLPVRWRHWGIAYLAAALLQTSAVAFTALVIGALPAYPFLGSLEILIIVFVALTFGAGPSLLATGIGGILLDFIALPPRFTWALPSGAYFVSLALFVVIGCVTSILASQTERARGIAEAARERTERLAFALADERARLEAVIEATPDRVAIFDGHGRLERMNAAAHLSGGSRQVPEGLSSFQQTYGLRRPSGEPWPDDELPLALALRGKIIADAELLIRDNEGRERTILSSVAPIRDANGQISGAVAITHDITALRDAQQTALERASQLEALIESMADGIFVYDTQGRILQTNAAVRKLFGFGAQPNYLTLPLDERLSRVETRDAQGQQLPVEQSPQQRVLRGETLAGDTATDYLLTALDGREVMVNVTGAPVRSADGRMYGGVLILRDVTEQRRLQRRTREALDAVLEMAQTLVAPPPDAQSDQRDQSHQDDDHDGAPHNGLDVARRIARLTCQVLGCARVGITAIDPETQRPRALAVVGLSPDQERQWWAEQRKSERRGARLGEGTDPALLTRFLAGESIVLDMTQPPYADLPNPYGITTTLVAPMLIGSQVIGILSLDYGGPPHVFTADEIRLASGVAQLGAVVLERDRLLRERAETQASLLAAQETNELMDEFLSVAGHELKTPITTTHVNLQLAQRRMRRLNEELARLDDSLGERIKPLLEPFDEILQRADSATRRQSRLVEDLLNVSRLQTGRLDLQMEPCDLAPIVRACVEDQRLSWPDRTITATLPEEPALVSADPDRIAQVVTNLLTNALKYSPADTAVAVTLTQDDGMARASVTDHGPGIPEAALPHLWQRFYRAPDIAVQSGSGVGLGLGLYICHEIVERHGGEIGVESQQGDGSTFWFTLPRACD